MRLSDLYKRNPNNCKTTSSYRDSQQFISSLPRRWSNQSIYIYMYTYIYILYIIYIRTDNCSHKFENLKKITRQTRKLAEHQKDWNHVIKADPLIWLHCHQWVNRHKCISILTKIKILQKLAFRAAPKPFLSVILDIQVHAITVDARPPCVALSRHGNVYIR